MKILVAENEQRAREGICKLIHSIQGDYQIVAKASNGEAALGLIEELTPDVVFTDIKMPYMDGITLIQEARARKLEMEFVVISAYADFQMAQKCISLDVTEYLLKPLTKNELETVLARLSARVNGQRLYLPRKGKGEGNLRSHYPDAHPMVLKALDIIEKGYNKKINQTELAENLGISPQYFSYIFSKHIGEGFSSYLKKYRISQAMKLLRDGEADKNDVAYKVGFSDMKYFHKVFKEVSGKNLSEYLYERRQE